MDNWDDLPQAGGFKILPRCLKCFGRLKEIQLITTKVQVCPKCDYEPKKKESSVKAEVRTAQDTPITGNDATLDEIFAQLEKELESGLKLETRNLAVRYWLEEMQGSLSFAVSNHNNNKRK